MTRRDVRHSRSVICGVTPRANSPPTTPPGRAPSIAPPVGRHLMTLERVE